jgi:hypothetical protein
MGGSEGVARDWTRALHHEGPEEEEEEEEEVRRGRLGGEEGVRIDIRSEMYARWGARIDCSIVPGTSLCYEQ